MKQRYTVKNGIDRTALWEEKVRGKRVGMLTAASGVNKTGKLSYRVLAEKCELVSLFAPEHGIRSSAQDGKYGVEQVEPVTGARICNLNSRDYSEAEKMLREVDLFCYDIQDVGARFYTYLWSLYDLMKICGRLGVPVLIFDRINMIGGHRVEGAILEERYSSFIGRRPIPTRYGLTVGELMCYLNEVDRLGCEITVIPLDGWRRGIYYDETDLLFVNPSPNIPSVSCAINYIGTCLVEATNLSEGRGTTRPFDLVGAPFLRGDEMCDYMNSRGLDGVLFRSTVFTPGFNKFAGEACEGVELHITDRESYEPLRAMMEMWKYLRTYEEFTFRRDGAALRFGTDLLAEDFDVNRFLSENREKLLTFTRETAKYHLYAD